jgi:hypothetical protein
MEKRAKSGEGHFEIDRLKKGNTIPPPNGAVASSGLANRAIEATQRRAFDLNPRTWRAFELGPVIAIPRCMTAPPRKAGRAPTHG